MANLQITQQGYILWARLDLFGYPLCEVAFEVLSSTINKDIAVRFKPGSMNVILCDYVIKVPQKVIAFELLYYVL